MDKELEVRGRVVEGVLCELPPHLRTRQGPAEEQLAAQQQGVAFGYPGLLHNPFFVGLWWR